MKEQLQSRGGTRTGYRGSGTPSLGTPLKQAVQENTRMQKHAAGQPAAEERNGIHSVADPGRLSRIPDLNFSFLDPWSKRF